MPLDTMQDDKDEDENSGVDMITEELVMPRGFSFSWYLVSLDSISAVDVG